MTRATVWPRELPASIRIDWRRAAEVRVYDALAAQLDQRWSVFYSRPWLGETPTGAEIDGECDFVVAHPDAGVLTIEVKGGGISFDAERNVWKSKDRHQISYTIKDPVEQARRSKHELLRKARADRSWPATFIRFRHGVIFPDIASVPHHLGADKPRELFATRPELDDIAAWVRQRLSGGNEVGPGAEGVRVLESLLAKPFQLRMPLSFVGADDDQAIQALTPQQYQILTLVGDLRRFAAGGGAGTGKTVLAIEDARRHSERGLRTLLTCGSEQLAHHLAQMLGGTKVEVATLVALAERLGRQAGLLASGAKLDSTTAAEMVVDSLAQRPELAFDAVIVDEAQDFPSHVWVAIEALASQTKDSVLHAYFDSNQRIYGELRNHFDGYELAPVRLAHNLRNTQRVHETALRFYEGPSLSAVGPLGTPVHWRVCEEEAIYSAVADEAHRLIQTEKVAPVEIAILASSEDEAALLKQKIHASHPIGPTITTIAAFKGLERRFVILAATRRLSDASELAYVALSRARAHLTVVGAKPVLEWLGNTPVAGAA